MRLGSISFLYMRGLLFVVDENHNDTSAALTASAVTITLRPAFFCRFGGLGPLIQPDDYGGAAFLEIERVGVSLAAVSDDA